jgi:hypothetical protein
MGVNTAAKPPQIQAFAANNRRKGVSKNSPAKEGNALMNKRFSGPDGGVFKNSASEP